MAWDRRSRSSSRRGPAAMNEKPEFSSSSTALQPWACSSLSSSEKFLSLYDKMLEDWEKKNFESMACSRFLLQQAPPLPQEQQEQQQEFHILPSLSMIEKPSSKIVFPHITSRGSVVGKKVYCRTSIHTSFTWRQKDSTQRMRTSLMILNVYQDRSTSCSGSDISVIDENQTDQTPGDFGTPRQRDKFPEKDQCRRLFLRLAGAAGMRLICPPVQLPLLEILLFFRQQLSSKNRAVFSRGGGGGGLWRFPLNLALATLRPFSGSLLGRCLTTLLCLNEMRIKKNITAEQTVRYMPVTDLYSVVFEKENLHDGDSGGYAISSKNRIRIDASVVTGTTVADGVYVAEMAKQNEIGTLLSNAVVGRKLDEECWNNEAIPVMKILIGQTEEGGCLSDNSNVPNFLFLDQSHGGFDEGRELSVVNLVLEDKFLKQKRSEGLITVLKRLGTSENALVASCPRFNFSVEEAREDETLAQSEYAGSPALQFRSESPNSNSLKEAHSVTVSSLDDSRGVAVEALRTLTDEMCIAEEEQPESTSSVAQITVDELVDEPFSARGGEGFGAAGAESSGTSSQLETLKNQLVSSNFQDHRKSVSFVRGESAAGGFFQLKLEVFPGGEHRTGGITDSVASVSDLLSPESLQKDARVVLSEAASAENIVEKEPGEEQSLAFGLTEAVRKAQEVLPSEQFVQEKPADEALDSPIDQLESLQEQTEVVVTERTNSEGKLAAAGPTELSPASTEAAVAYHVVEEIQEGNLEYWLEKDSEDIVLDCSIDELIESVQQQIESFLSERIGDEEYLETPPEETSSSGSMDVPENHAVEEIQEGKATHSIEAKSAGSVLDETPEVSLIEEHKIDDGNCVFSDVAQRHTAAGFQSKKTSAEKESGDKESLAASAEIDTEENMSLGLVKGVQTEAVDITEVKSTHLVEEAHELLFELELEQFRPIEGHSTDISDYKLLEREQRLTNVSLKADNKLEKGSRAVAAVTFPHPESQYLSSTGNQAVDEILSVEPANSVEENAAEEILDRVLEVCPIEDCGSDESMWLLSERLLGQGVEVFLPETGSAGIEIEKESSDSPRGHFEAGFDEDASVPDQEESDSSSSSIGSQENRTGKEQDPSSSSSPTSMCTMADDDSQSEETFASGAMSRQSCQEHPDFDLIICNGESISESPTHTSSTSRLNIVTETQKNALGPDSGAMSFIANELNRDRTNEARSETAAKIVDVVTSSDSIGAHEDSQLTPGPINTETVDSESITTTVSGSDDEKCSLDRQLSAVADEIGVSGVENYSPEMCPISPLAGNILDTEYCGVPESYPEHPFADHPTCIDLRERRHSHGDQTYIEMEDLLPPPWGQLIFWHGRCKEGRPTLCVLLGKAVRQLDSQELKHFIAVTVSHLEYAEINFFKGNVKQMNILMDLDGLGFMRLPPMHILSSIGAVLNRDYAGRGGWIILVNAPVMLGFVISAIQGVILRPSQNKGAVIDSEFRGFLEGKECILMSGSKYRQLLLKHFDSNMLPVALGGDCPCGSNEEPCKLGIDFLKLNRSSLI